VLKSDPKVDRYERSPRLFEADIRCLGWQGLCLVLGDGPGGPGVLKPHGDEATQIDNYTTHKSPVITKWLAAHPRFHMHFTPTYSSWLNQVERWFALLTDEKLRRGAHRSIQALENDIRDWIANWNANPQPFNWTKSADEILERLASYLQRIPGAGH
jgi:hypothetical protein